MKTVHIFIGNETGTWTGVESCLLASMVLKVAIESDGIYMSAMFLTKYKH